MIKRWFALLILSFGALSLVLDWSSQSSQAGSFWSAPEAIIEPAPSNVGVTKLDRTLDGKVHILARGPGEYPNSQLLYIYRNPAGSWSDPEMVAEFRSDTAKPAMFVAGDGLVYVIYPHNPGGGDNILYYTVRDTAGSWSDPLALSGANHDVQGLDVTATEDRVFVSWYSMGTAGLFMRMRESGGSWSDLQQVDNGAGFPISAVRRLDSAGNFHFFWADPSSVATQGGAYHRPLLASGNWGAETRVSNDLASPIDFVTNIQADAEGIRLYLSWAQGDGMGNTKVYFAENAGAGWSEPLPLNGTGSSWFVGYLDASDAHVSLIASQSVSRTLWTRPHNGSWLAEPLNFLTTPDPTNWGAAHWGQSLHLVWSEAGDSPLQYRWRDGNGVWSPMETIDDNADGLFVQVKGQDFDLAWNDDTHIYYSHAVKVLPYRFYLPVVVD